MRESLEILSQNMDFVGGAYNMKGLMGVFFLITLVDLLLKGWALWRAAGMKKVYWFVALLLVNSMGIFPIIFLLMTNTEYKKSLQKS